MGTRLAQFDPTALGASKSARILATIRRDMDLKDSLMRKRRRNEEILALSYHDSGMTTSVVGGGNDADNLRENALNLPYRYVRWLESQATSGKMVVKVNQDAGEGQVQGGPADSATGMWTGITLGRVAYEAGFNREIKAIIGEVLPRGTSVMQIGYHEEVINLAQSKEVGKDPQSVVPEVLGDGDTQAKPGQAHSEISSGLATMAQDPMVQVTAGQAGVQALLARKASHDAAEYQDETTDIPKQSTRLIRRKIWMRKRRVGEEVGWHPAVYDIEDSDRWWERHVWTVAEVKASTLFTTTFKSKVKGYDGRNVSGVSRGGQTVSTQSMGSDARQAQIEDVLDEDERMVEWFAVWFRKPDMKSGGIRKIVSAEVPDEFIEADDNNPYVDDNGFGTIPGFFPFYDFTPILPSLTIPERTCGIPPIAVGMTQFEKIAEYNRLRHESALRHSLRLYEIHPSLKDDKKLLDALKNGEDGYAYVAKSAQLDSNNKVVTGVTPIQFTGNTQEIDRQAAREESDWVKMMAMPPAVLQGVGTAGTLGQDQIGVAAGERESAALVGYFEDRVCDVLAGVRGLLRCNYDDEDFIRLLGEEGAAVMKAWQTGTTDDGDSIEVTFGANAQAQKTVETKQTMEAMQLEQAQVEPITGLPKYDSTPLFNDLHRKLGVGAPKIDDTPMRKLQQMVLALMQQVQTLSGVQPGAPGAHPPTNGAAPKPNGQVPHPGPSPAEGNGPQQGTLAAGAARGTLGAHAGP